jgi:cytidylate kinase
VQSTRLVIAIDGPAASGKSTTARLVAQRLGYLHVDTGAMYRAVTLKVLRQGISPSDVERISRLVESTRVELKGERGTLRVVLDGEDVTDPIRSPEVTRAVSAVSSLGAVRRAMVREQRTLGRNGGIVLEGRDIGTVVFPDADCKFFLIAGILARATRRMEEFQEKGVTGDLAELEAEIAERDRKDSTREESPLRKADDAIEIDTSDLTIEAQVERVLGIVQERLKRKGSS